jgi:tetratricopeptide (TPR) repeat protein
VSRNRPQFEEALNRGHAYNWDQRWEEAIKEFEKAVKLAPNEPAAYEGLGTAYRGLDRMVKALENYKLAARYSRGDVIYLRQVADMQELLHQESEAGRTYLAIGEVELGRRRLKEAVDYWRRAIMLEPDLLQAHRRLASVYKRQQSIPSAIREYLEMARILQAEKKNQEALASCQEALELDPRNKDILTSIELIKQGTPIADSKKRSTSPLNPVAEDLPRMSAALDRVAQKPALETVAPVQDARRTAMEQLAEKLFEEAADMKTSTLISQALDAQTRGMTNEAISYYEQIMQAGVRGPAIHFNLGLLYQDKLRFEDAIKQFEVSVQDHDFRLASHFALGESHRARGRIEEAIENFITVLQIVDLTTVQHAHSDRLIELYENLADSLMAKGERDQATSFANALVEFLSHKGWEDKVKEARARLQQISNTDMMILGDVLTAGSEQVLESLYLSQEYTRRKLYDSAVEEAFRAIQLSAEYLPAHLQLAEALSKQGRREAAALKFSVIADTYQTRSDINGAILSYEKVIDLTPLDVKAYTKLIDLLKQHGRIDEAIRYLTSLGESHYQLAKVDKARETYQEALKLVPRGTDPALKAKLLRAMADLDMQRFDWRRALVTYKELRELAPDDERTAITLVDLYYKVDQPNNAVSELDKYLIQLVRKGRGTKLLGILEDMIRQRPSDANLVDRLFRLYIQQKRVKDAVNLLDRLGELQLEAGDTTGAIRTIERIVSLKPANVGSYQQLLGQLKQ